MLSSKVCEVFEYETGKSVANIHDYKEPLISSKGVAKWW
jgi:hypothetical protein